MSLLEQEARWFWDAMSEINAIKRSTADPTLMQSAIEEIEAIALNTDWPLLRRRCLHQMAQYNSADTKAAP